MKQDRKTCAVALLWFTLALTALAGCGGGNAHPGAAASAAPPASGSPTAPAPSLSPTTAAPAARVVSTRVTYPWHWQWPNDMNQPASVQHTYPVPPMPLLIAIRAGHHPRDSGARAYDRMSFTFTTAFPSYQFQFVSALLADPSGRPVAVAGTDVLKVTFREAQAHTAAGGTSVASQPPAHLGLTRMTSWAPAGDFEGVLTYGIGVTRPIPHSNAQLALRATEVEEVTPQGQHRYVVAIDVGTTAQAGQS
jgi:hypothetical protein